MFIFSHYLFVRSLLNFSFHRSSFSIWTTQGFSFRSFSELSFSFQFMMIWTTLLFHSFTDDSHSSASFFRISFAFLQLFHWFSFNDLLLNFFIWLVPFRPSFAYLLFCIQLFNDSYGNHLWRSYIRFWLTVTSLDISELNSDLVFICRFSVPASLNTWTSHDSACLLYFHNWLMLSVSLFLLEIRFAFVLL